MAVITKIANSQGTFNLAQAIKTATASSLAGLVVTDYIDATLAGATSLSISGDKSQKCIIVLKPSQTFEQTINNVKHKFKAGQVYRLIATAGGVSVWYNQPCDDVQ